MHTILGHIDLDIDLWPHFYVFFLCLEHISYITANFPQMCLMLGQFLWGHSSSDCDISCSFMKLISSKIHFDLMFEKNVI